LARTLGCQEDKNGIAANATPIAPVPTVAAVNSRRRLWSTCSLIRLKPPDSVHKSSRNPKKKTQCFPKNVAGALYTD
jgi:hypothetical protein